jgi:2-polyprenyl-3-methyl-5-hydroxy-6-metoxy-1,4-benzoquinol methylase
MDAVEYYSSIAPSYESLYREEQLGKIREIITVVQPKKSWKILDIGAGTGLLEENLKGFDITALEPSEMFDILERKKLSRVKLLHKTISQFSSSDKFDAVFCITVLQDLNKSERRRCIKKAFYYCKKKGVIVISVLKQSNIDLSKLKPVLVEEAQNDVFYLFKKG